MADRLALHPMTGCLGAEVEGLDLNGEVGETQAAALRAALFDHQLLVVRGQHLDLARQKRLTEIFGPLQRLPYVEPLAGEPEVIAVLKEAEERNVGVFGGDWHSDFSFLDRPPAGSVLNAVEVPPFGGDTLWANQIAAFETLPDELKAEVEGRCAVHSGTPYGVAHVPPEETRAGAGVRITRGDPEADRERLHPMVRRHPESGRRALFVNPIYTIRIDGLDEAASRPLLKALYRHATRPELCCRLRWRPGDLAIWDNRTTLHYAVNDYDGRRRLLYRTTFADSAPPQA